MSQDVIAALVAAVEQKLCELGVDVDAANKPEHSTQFFHWEKEVCSPEGAILIWGVCEMLDEEGGSSPELDIALTRGDTTHHISGGNPDPIGCVAPNVWAFTGNTQGDATHFVHAGTGEEFFAQVVLGQWLMWMVQEFNNYRR